MIPPFKSDDLVVAKQDVWKQYPNGSETLVFHKGEVLKVRICNFFSRRIGWTVNFRESERKDRHTDFRHDYFQLKAEYDMEMQMNIFQRIIQRIRELFS